MVMLLNLFQSTSAYPWLDDRTPPPVDMVQLSLLSSLTRQDLMLFIQTDAVSIDHLIERRNSNLEILGSSPKFCGYILNDQISPLPFYEVERHQTLEQNGLVLVRTARTLTVFLGCIGSTKPPPANNLQFSHLIQR